MIQSIELQESMDLLRTMAKSLGIDLEASLAAEREKQSKKKRQDPEKEIKEITDKILAAVKAKVSKVQTKKSAQGKVIYYHIKIGHSEYVLKSYILEGIGHLSLMLWDEEQKTFIDVIASGYVKDHYKLIAVGKSRLSRWG